MDLASTQTPTDAQRNPQPVRVGVIGYGWWGRVIGRQLASSERFTLGAIAESDPTVRDAMSGDAQTMGFTVLADADELIARTDLDAVVLCTPHQSHAQQIVSSAQSGKHVFCEKPLCLTLVDAQRAVAECEQRHLVLGIGHERRFEPALIAMRREIAAGTFGTVLQIEANFSQDKFFALPPDNWRLSNRFAPVGPLTATGIHLVDLAVAILGCPETVWARLATRGSQFENGDTLAVMMGFPGGANAMISAILATPFEGRFAVYGSEGWMEIRDRTHPEQPSGWDVTRAMRGKPRETQFWAPYPAVSANLEAFAKAIQGVEPYPVSASEMLANVASLEAIMKSVDSRGLEQVMSVA
jgi:predicted dehydrogenase